LKKAQECEELLWEKLEWKRVVRLEQITLNEEGITQGVLREELEQ